jgi:hypothetical protein
LCAKSLVVPDVSNSEATSGNPLLEPCRQGSRYEILHCTNQPYCVTERDIHWHKACMHSGLPFSIRMLSRRLVSIEFKDHSLLVESGDEGRRITDRVIFSDLLSQTGIWRQPLEIIVRPFDNVFKSDEDDPLESLVTSLLLWHKRLWVVQQSGCATQITAESPDKLLQNTWLDSFDSCWTTTKIMMALFMDWPIEKLEELCRTLDMTEPMNGPTDILIDYMKCVVGLVVDSGNTEQSSLPS